MLNLYVIIIAGYNANTSKFYKILSLLWQERKVNNYSKSQSRDKIL